MEQSKKTEPQEPVDRYEILNRLITMSRNLGQPENDYVILGEGNTSARVDDSTFWVKASGTKLHGIDANGFVEMNFDRVLRILDSNDLSDEEIKRELGAARMDPAVETWPSIETVLHALVLTLGEAKYVGHTHPTAVNAILCSQKTEEAIQGRLFPDEIVVCGPIPAYVPYADPGLPLARKVWEVLTRYPREHGENPRVILMQNHGLIALGSTPDTVENITSMYVKTARILLGTYTLGGPRFLSAGEVERIHTRPDELYRRKKLGKSGSSI